MKKFAAFLFCSLVFGFTATAFADQVTLPKRACDCATTGVCSCPPGECSCPECLTCSFEDMPQIPRFSQSCPSCPGGVCPVNRTQTVSTASATKSASCPTCPQSTTRTATRTTTYSTSSRAYRAPVRRVFRGIFRRGCR